MSQWTHINAVIRFDGIKMLSPVLPDLGNTCTYDSEREDWDKCNVPCGSEGSMQYQVWTNPSENSLAANTVMFWGDLRDYSDEEEILSYFKMVVRGKMIRSGLLEIDIEGSLPKVFVYNRDHNEWERFAATTPETTNL